MARIQRSQYLCVFLLTSLIAGPMTLAGLLEPSCEQANPAPAYEGALDVVDCERIAGWASDRNRAGESIAVTVWQCTDGNGLRSCKRYKSVKANFARLDVAAHFDESGSRYGFEIATPEEWEDGRARYVRVTFGSTEIELGNDIVNREGREPMVRCR